MLVKATVNLGTNDYPSCPLKEGEVGEVSDTAGAVMLAAGHAIDVTPPVVAKPSTEHAVTSTPEVPAVKQKPRSGK